jgi:hypothetical protein
MEFVAMSKMTGKRSHDEDTQESNALALPTNSTAANSRFSRQFGRGIVASLVPFANYGAQKLGHLGVIGISVFLFSLVAMISANLPLHQQISSQSVELEGARAAAGGRNRSGQRETEAGTAQRLVDELPTQNDLPQILGKISSIATEAGMALERGSYEFSATESSSISSYRLSLPVRGSYPQVRKFIEETLAAIPVVALESMRVDRNDVSDQFVIADLEFAVLVRNVP